MEDDGKNPLRPIVEQWLRKIKSAKKIKLEKFGKLAEEAMRFYAGNHDFMWREEYATGNGGFLAKGGTSSLPTFRMTVNKPFEAVALFGPALFFQNPNVLATVTDHPQIDPAALGFDMQDPAVEQQVQMMQYQDQLENQSRQADATTIQAYLNWSLQEQDLKLAARRSITETLVKGMGLLWIEMFECKATGFRYPVARHVSVDDFVQDPDADYVEDVQWVARYHLEALNKVEEKFNLPPGSLKGHLQSANAQGDMTPQEQERLRRRKDGRSFDLIGYWEVFSKNGFGNKLKGMDGKLDVPFDLNAFGDNCYLAVAAGVPYPLNMPTASIAEGDEALFMRAQWPIPCWVDEGCGNGWPFSRLTFYEKPKDVWPVGLFTPCIGELRFINWCMSFLADKVAASSTTYLVALKAAGAEIQQQIKTGLAPYTYIEISESLGKNISEIISFLNAPSFSMDIWKMISEVMVLIDKRTGLTELLYGITATQIRSAKEADIRDENISVRPDDMATRVEDWLSETSMKLAEAALWNQTPEEVTPIVGRFGAMAWQRMATEGIDKIIRHYDFRIETGSTKKPNKSNRLEQLKDLGNSALPVFQALAEQGQPGPLNSYLAEIAKTMDLDPQGFLVQPPPQTQGPSPEEVKSQATQQESQAKIQESQSKIQLDQVAAEQKRKQESQAFKQEMSHKKTLGKVEIDIRKAKARAAAKDSPNGSRK